MKRFLSTAAAMSVVSAGSDASASASFNKRIGQPLSIIDDCFEPLVRADSSEDNYISNTEYIAFIKEISESYAGEDNPIDEFDENNFLGLPHEFIFTYNSLHCSYVCKIQPYSEGCSDSSCPEGGIPISGARNAIDFDYYSNAEKLYLYEVCEETIYTIKKFLNPETSPPESNDRDITLTSTVRTFIGLANSRGLVAEEIVADKKSMDIIEGVFSELKDEITKNLYFEQISATRRRRAEVDAQNSRIFAIDDVTSCPDSDSIPDPDDYSCALISGAIEIIVLDEDPTLVQNQVTKQVENYLSDGRLNFYIPPDKREEYIIYNPNVETNSFPFILTTVAFGAVLIGLFAGRALVVNRRTRGAHIPEDEDESEFPASPRITDMKTFDEELARNDMTGTMAVGTFNCDGNLSVDESSSNAGSSGWSSSAGVSSLNTGSVDSVEYFGSSLAAIGAASNVHKKYTTTNKNEIPMYPIKGDDESSNSSASGRSSFKSTNINDGSVSSVSRTDLEAQIEEGNWAAVGATAAVLARESNSVSASSMSTGSSGFFSAGISSGVSSGISSLMSTTSEDRSRAAELDRLVDAGDWEGVVMTAAKFEAEDDDTKSHISEGQISSNKSSAAGSFANSSAYSPSVSTNISDSVGSNLKRAEIRAEVEALVRRVVPDEIENVDEMMSQFLGHEEDLLERLRTMQERSIAARQREASRRNAKREAKKLAKEAKKANNKSVGLPPRPSPPRVAQSHAETASLVGSSKEDSMESSASEWEAVGVTAAQLDSSINTSEFESAVDESSAGYLSATSARASDEEEEARAQAEIWMAIAKQNKAKGSNAIGAGDAAEWAISRSLKQIENSSKRKDVSEVQSTTSSNDDKSV